MKKLIAVFSVVLVFAWSELPVSVGISTTAGVTKNVCVDHEIVVEKNIDKLNGVTVGLENLYCYDASPSYETSLGMVFGTVDWLGLGLYSKFFTEERVAFGLNGLAALEFDIEKIGLVVTDDNEYLYEFSNKFFEYVNTFGLEQNLFEKGDFGLSLGYENALVVSDGAVEDSMLVGPSVSYKVLGFGAAYVLSAYPEVEHSGQVVFSLTFE